MSQFVFTLLNGVTLAGVFFLVASGLTLIFGLMRVINLAHGGYYLFAAYFSWTIMDKVHNWALGALISAIFMAVAGTIIYLVLLRKFQYEELRVALITLGISLILQQLMLALFGGDAYQISVPTPLRGIVAVPGVEVNFPKFKLVFLLFAVIVGVGLWLLISKTKFGSIIRAGVDDTMMVSARHRCPKSIYTCDCTWLRIGWIRWRSRWYIHRLWNGNRRRLPTLLASSGDYWWPRFSGRRSSRLTHCGSSRPACYRLCTNSERCDYLYFDDLGSGI